MEHHVLIVPGLRAHWFRYSAQKSRWTEEVNTAREEMFRTLNSYRREWFDWQVCAAEREAEGGVVGLNDIWEA